MAIRNLLHMDKLEEFEGFLRAEGYKILPLSKNPYEALRAKKGRDTIIIYRRSDSKEHLSIMDKDFELVEKFLHRSRDAPEPDPWGFGEGAGIDTELPWD